jgi:hypothetical protein
MDTRSINLAALNSATKYPSILTYHGLGEKGRLTDDRLFDAPADLIVTEKIDGTNTRLIFMPDGYYLIGSREHLLYARGDLIGNPALDIVESIKPMMEGFNAHVDRGDGHVHVAFLETYGGKTTAAAHNYTGSRAFGHRLFDFCTVPLDRLDANLEEIAIWREHGGQNFYAEAELNAIADRLSVKLTDRLTAKPLPENHPDTLAWLEAVLPRTQAALDDAAGGIPEGVVVRTPDRSKIAKIRFEDYRRTLKGKK